MLKQVLDLFGDFESCQDLCLELAAVIDAGVHFVNATYYLERAGPLIFSCYERLSAAAQAVAVDHSPNTEAVARKIANGNIYIQVMAQAKACIRTGLNLYHHKFRVQFRDKVHGIEHLNVAEGCQMWRTS